MTVRCDHGALVDLEEKAVTDGEDSWIVTGYGSVFNNKDLGNDVMMPGAFAKSLREDGLPLLLFNHKMEDAPIGTIVDAKEDRKGLWFKAELPKDDSFVSGRIVPQLKRRGLRGTSIGYRTIDKETRKSDGARLLKAVKLVEISIVNRAMNPLAMVDTVRGVVANQDHFIRQDVKDWDAEKAFERLKERFGDSEELKSAFFYVDEDKARDDWDRRLLFCDVDDKGRLYANPIAMYKCVASLVGARGGVDLPEDAGIAVNSNLKRYYSRLNFEDPFKSLSVEEYESLEIGEREARLRGLGLSRKLAATFAGQRDADRSSVQRDAGSQADADELSAGDIAALRGLLSVIRKSS